MESQIIKDIEIKQIKEDNSKVRVIGKVISSDEKTGIFEIEDEGSKLTCMSMMGITPPKIGEMVIVTGRTVSTDSSFELRIEAIQSININDYNNYKRYLKIRDDLLNNYGSRI